MVMLMPFPLLVFLSVRSVGCTAFNILIHRSFSDKSSQFDIERSSGYHTSAIYPRCEATSSYTLISKKTRFSSREPTGMPTMQSIFVSLAAVLVFLPMAMSQAPVWGQCGGQGYTGPTTCAIGSACVYENPFFSNCFPTAASASVGSNDAAKSLGGKLYFGTEVENYELNDPAYAAKLGNSSLFGQITPASLRWDKTEPVQGFFTFEEGDAMVKFTKKNGQLVRGPSCVSYDELPNWVNSAAITAGALQNMLVNHCSTLFKHYAGQMYAWDVVNEPWTDDGFTRPVGYSPSAGLFPEYMETLLSVARSADPGAKLYLTSSGMDTQGPKFQSMLGEVKYCQDHGIPIDGIGFRSHFTVGGVPSRDSLIANYEAFTALGVEVAVTALDIRMGVVQTGADLVQQQADYQTVISACKAVVGCVGVTLADFTDKYSPVPAAYPGSGNALPWDYNFNPKLAYDGIIAGFTK
ncbi:endo-1,4-beta-xylanase A precursor [Mycena crocata]|nr:endo-1,4-beta-xylanase A precursor [Mycena crocata]